MLNLRKLVLPCFEIEWEEADAAVILLSALAFGMKWGKVGAALLDYQSGAECPQCGAPLPVVGERPLRR